MALGWQMDELVRKHSAIMDQHDPDKKVAMIVDEWGAWYKAEEGTNPRFLYQQQTVRDAVLAALSLNVFIKNCDRVRFANLAQIVNVLQAIVLTEPEGGRLLLTPTWDVFALYAVHQDAQRLPFEIETAQLSHDAGEFPQVSAAASRAANGEINVTLANTDSAQPVKINLSLAGVTLENVKARVVASPTLNACNTFDHPRTITTADLADVTLSGDQASLTLPAASVVALNFS
jgi:alpha-N-arabinofuranosidase